MAYRHLAKAGNHVEGFMATASLEAAQQQLDRHHQHQIGSEMLDEALALPGPGMKAEEIGKSSTDPAFEKIEEPTEGGGPSAVKMQGPSGVGVSSKAEDVGKRYPGDCPFGGPAK